MEPSAVQRSTAGSAARSSALPPAARAVEVPAPLPAPSSARPPRVPGAGLRKPPGARKKPAAPCRDTAPTPTHPAPTSAAASFPNAGGEDSVDDEHNLFDEFPRSDHSFMEMVTGDVGINDMPFTQQIPSLDEEVIEATPTKKKGARSANYSTQEDEALVMAWESVTLDAAIGTDQNSNTYWKRIAEHFHRNVKSPSNRSLNSLQHRWGSIQECCNRWAGCYEQVERLHPSGVPFQEHINYAQELYKQKDKDKHRPFTMLHCWTLLRHNEKWIARNNECPPKRPRSSNSSSLELGHEEEGDANDEERGRSPTPSSVPLKKRPPGRKQEKERLKREGYGGGCKEAIQEMIKTKKEMEAERKLDKDTRWMELKAIEDRKVAIEEERLRLLGEDVLTKKKEQEHKIMFMDTTSLDDTQRAYVEAMRGQILASTMTWNMGGTRGSGGDESGSM